MERAASYISNYLPARPTISLSTDNWAKYAGITAGATAAAVGTLVAWRSYKYRGLPPGPRSGIMGATDVVNLQTFEYDLHKLAKKYGDIFSLRLGSSVMIILASQPLIKEAFVKNGDTFAHRGSDIYTLQHVGKLKEDIFTKPYSTDGWNQTKTTIMGCLRSAGFGTTKSSEERILDEMEVFFKYLDPLRANNTPVNLRNILPKVTVNVMFQVMFSDHFSFDDPKLQENIDIIRGFLRSVLEGIDFDTVPKIIGDIFYRSHKASMRKRVDHLRRVVRTYVEDHIRDFDANNPRDFIDNFILKFGSDDIERIVDNIMVFTPDSSDTLALVLEWVLLYLANFRDIQECLAKQIYDLTSGSRQITWADKSRLPLVEATIKEVIRLSSPVSLTVSHCVKKDIIFHGYRIPRNVTVLGALYTAHRDPRIFKDPDSFNPDRFLNPDDGSLMKTDTWIPFSMGRRKCLGEQLANIELFLVVSNFVQTYDFCLPKGTKADLDPCLNHYFSRPPNEFTLILEDRKYP